MIFKVRRTSMYRDEMPMDGAIKRPFESWHTRTCTEEEFNERFSEREGLWRSKGKNHTINLNGFITRQEDDIMLWSIEINTLEELLKISETQYDDYRE